MSHDPPPPRGEVGCGRGRQRRPGPRRGIPLGSNPAARTELSGPAKARRTSPHCAAHKIFFEISLKKRTFFGTSKFKEDFGAGTNHAGPHLHCHSPRATVLASTMRWEFSAPLSRKRWAFSIQVPEKYCRYLRTHRMHGRPPGCRGGRRPSAPRRASRARRRGSCSSSSCAGRATPRSPAAPAASVEVSFGSGSVS